MRLPVAARLCNDKNHHDTRFLNACRRCRRCAYHRKAPSLHFSATDSHRAGQALTDALRPARQRKFPRQSRAQFALCRRDLQLSAFSFAIYRPNSQISRQISSLVLQTVTSTGLLQNIQTRLANIQADLQFGATNCDIHRPTPKYSDQLRKYPGMSLTWCYSLEHPGNSKSMRYPLNEICRHFLSKTLYRYHQMT